MRLLYVFLFFVTPTLALERECKIQGPEPKVTFLSPVEYGAPFWFEFEESMKEAAKQLCLDLTIERLIYEEHNRFSVFERYQSIVNSEDKPNYFISFLQRNIEAKSLQLFEDNEVNFISVNTGLAIRTQTVIGLPRQQYPHWLAHVSPNDLLAGQESMDGLIALARRNREDASSSADSFKSDLLRVLAFGGPTNSSVGQERLKGVYTSVQNHSDVNLLQSLHTPWRGAEVKRKAKLLFERHGIPDIIWTPTDVIALDVLDVLGDNANAPVVGGFDWSKAGIASIVDEELDLSSGGHFFDGAWALVIVHDHYNNIGLHSSENGIFLSKMSNITLESILDKKEWLEQEQWRNIDFRQYSKVFSPYALEHGYRFSIDD